MKHALVLIILTAISVGGASFFGGITYQKNKQPVLRNGRFPGNGSNQGQMRLQRGLPGGMQPLGGTITTLDDTTMTVKMPDGSSKLIIIAGSTKIVKTAETTKTELKVGEQVTAVGTPNPDGSVTAQNISLGNFMFRFGEPASPSASPQP